MSALSPAEKARFDGLGGPYFLFNAKELLKTRLRQGAEKMLKELGLTDHKRPGAHAHRRRQLAERIRALRCPWTRTVHFWKFLRSATVQRQRKRCVSQKKKTQAKRQRTSKKTLSIPSFVAHPSPSSGATRRARSSDEKLAAAGEEHRPNGLHISGCYHSFSVNLMHKFGTASKTTF